MNEKDRDYLGEYVIPGYSIYHKDRQGRIGGGVLFLINENMQVTEVIFTAPKQDIISVNIIGKGSKKIQITLVYRPPKITATDDIDLYNNLDQIITADDGILIGDFNIPDINWSTLESLAPGKRLLNLTDNKFMTQKITKPTRGNNILDLLFSTKDSLVTDIEIGEGLGTSDHCCIRFNINSQTKSSKNNTKIPNLRLANFDGLRETLGTTSFPLGDTAQVSLSNFVNILKTAEREHIPLKNRRNGNHKPKYWDRDLQLLQSLKKNSYSAWRNTNTDESKAVFYNIRRQFKKTQKRKQKDYEIEIARNAKSNPKQFFSYISSKKNTRSTIGPLFDTNQELITDDTSMCELLNNYFISVFTEENNENPQPEDLFATANIMPLETVVFTALNVAIYIKKLKATKSPGPDQIHPRIIKEIVNEISLPLSEIFHQSLTTEQCPPQWKEANVTPIFKKGSKRSPCNYRPISLTSIVGKLMESIITDKITLYLEENKLIGNTQHGFRHHRSCLTNLLLFFNSMIEIYDEKSPLDIIYLDFQKAFDKVPHRRLISKLHSLGIRGNIKNWIKNWLHERKQRVVLNGSFSEWDDVTSGVPQGSVLGPVLFIIYINDLDTNIVSHISKFADDTKVGSKAVTPADFEQIQNDLKKIEDWSTKWQMQFNVDKCKVMHVGHNNPNHDYFMSGKKLITVKEEKDLGVIITDDFKTGKQCNEAAKKANKMLGLIKRTITYKTRYNIMKLFNAFVRPHLEYSIQFWSPHYRKDIIKIEQIQRRATKLIPQLRNKSYENRLKELDLFTLEKRRTRGDMIEVWKIMKGKENIDRADLFTLDETGITRSNGFKIVGKRFNTVVAQHFFTHRVVSEWNNLPHSVVNCNSIDTFKMRIDKYYKQRNQLLVANGVAA